MGPLQLSDNVVQKCQTGEQMTYWDIFTHVQYTQTDTIRQFRSLIGTNGTIDTNRR